MFISIYSSTIYISRILKLLAPKNKVFALGESSIETELKSEGIEFISSIDTTYR